MNHRGQAEMVEWFPRIVMIIVAVVVIAFLVTTFSNRDVSAPTLYMETYLYRIYYSDIIMYRDPATQRVYPGIVDMSKFTSQSLDAVFVEQDPTSPGSPSKIASMLQVTPSLGCVGVSGVTIYNNQQTYNAYVNYVTSGPGGMSQEVVTYPVTLMSGKAQCAGTLTITIVRPNT